MGGIDVDQQISRHWIWNATYIDKIYVKYIIKNCYIFP